MPDVRAHLPAHRRVDGEDVRAGEERAPRKTDPPAPALDRHRELAGVRAREDDIVRRRRLVGDVRARVARADDEHRPVLELRQVAVVARVELGDARVELARELGRVRPLEDAGGDDDVVGLEAPVAGGRHVAAVLLRRAPSTAVPLRTGQLEARRVRLQVVGHLVLRRVRGAPRRERASRAARRGTPASRAAASPSALRQLSPMRSLASRITNDRPC